MLLLLAWALGFAWFALALPGPAGEERTDALRDVRRDGAPFGVHLVLIEIIDLHGQKRPCPDMERDENMPYVLGIKTFDQVRREMERRQLGSLRLLRPDVRRAQSGVVLRRQTARLRLRGPVSSRRGRALIVATGAAEQQRDGQVAELIKRAPGPVPTLGSYLHHFTLRILSICRFHNTLPEVQRPKPAPFTGTQKPAPRFLRRACVPCYLACLP